MFCLSGSICVSYTQYVWCLSHCLVKVQTACVSSRDWQFANVRVCVVWQQRRTNVWITIIPFYSKDRQQTDRRGTWTTINNLVKYTTLYLYSHVKSLYYKQPWFLLAVVLVSLFIHSPVQILWVSSFSLFTQTNFPILLFNSNDLTIY